METEYCVQVLVPVNVCVLRSPISSENVVVGATLDNFAHTLNTYSPLSNAPTFCLNKGDGLITELFVTLVAAVHPNGSVTAVYVNLFAVVQLLKLVDQIRSGPACVDCPSKLQCATSPLVRFKLYAVFAVQIN
jgi:hypothetical protein